MKSLRDTSLHYSWPQEKSRHCVKWTMKWIRVLREKWKVFGYKVGNFQARLVLSLFYFIVICPFAVVVKFVSKPLRLKVFNTSNWLPNQTRDEDILSRARKQF